MAVTFFVANSNLMELTSPRIDLSEANRQVDRVENKSSEPTTIDNPTSVPSSSSTALTRTFPSSTASPAANVSAEMTNLTGSCDLWELQEGVWKEDAYSNFPKRSPARYENYSCSFCLLASAKTSIESLYSPFLGLL